MAVEIPVIIDIDAAFADAAKKVPQAMQPLQNSIKKLNEDLSVYSDILGDVDIDSEDFKQAAKEIQNIAQAVEVANDKFLKLSTNEGSIRRLSGEIASLNRRWEEMGAQQKFMSNGAYTDDAKKLVNDYKKATAELEKQGLTLEQVIEKERRLTDLKQKGIQTRRYENAILNSTVKTTAILEEKERILSNRLKKSVVGSTKYSQLKKELEGVRRELDSINGAAGRAGTSLSTLIKNSIQLIALHAAGSFVRNVREVTAEFELQKVALGSIIQDTERAEGLFRQIKAAAIESPFEIKDLVSYTKQLSAYQIETDKLFDTTMKLADVSSGLGVDMGRLILAFGQVRAAAVLRGQELRQFTEAGIPLVEKLAEKFRELGREGTTTADVFQLISERAVPFSMVSEIFDDMTNAGGMFYKMQEKQAKTLAGQWANLKDSLSIMYDEIGNTDAVHGAMEAMIRDARWMMQHWQMFGEAIKGATAALVTYVSLSKMAEMRTKLLTWANTQATLSETAREKSIRKVITSLVGESAAEAVSTTAKNIHTAATVKLAAATTLLGKAFWGLTAALASNPFGVLAIAVAGVIALVNTLSNKTRDLSKDIDTANNSINALNKSREETAKLIDEYDALSKKQKLTVDESKKLKDVTSDLAAAFPKASEGIDKNTHSLSLNVEKMKELNKEMQTAQIKGLQAQIRVDKKEVKKNEKEIERLSNDINRGWGMNKYNRTQRMLGGQYLVGFSDKQLAEMNARILELQKTNEQYTQSIKEMQDAIDGVKEEAGGAVKNVTEWQKKLEEFNSRKNDKGENIRIMLDDQIEGYSSLDQALEDVAKQYKAEAETVKILEAALKDKNGEEEQELRLALARAAARKELSKEILDYYNAFFLTQKKSGGGGSQKTDPFITNMKDRIKFMQDFKKGYEDLKKYMQSTAALGNESKIMEGRGLSLGMSVEEQNKAANNLEDWYRDMLKTVADKLKKNGVKGTSAAEIIGFDTSKKSKTVKDLQALFQQLWEGLTDLRTDEIKKKLEAALKKLEEDIKNSEEARNFYKDIFDLTGDKQIAASMAISVYGEPGKEFADRIQDSINGAMSKIGIKPDSDLGKKLSDAAKSLDFREILNMDNLPKELKEVVENADEAIKKYNVDTLKSYSKLLMKFDEINQQRINIENQADKDIATLRAGLALELKGIDENQSIQDKAAAKKAAKDRVDAVIAGIEAEKDLELFRLKRDYRLFFESVGTISLASARKVARAEREMVTAQFEAGQISLSKFQRELQKIDEQLKKYEQNKNPLVTYFQQGLDGLFDKMKEYGNNLRSIAGNLRDDDGKFSITEDMKETINSLGEMLGGKIFGVTGRKNVFDKLSESLGENEEKWKQTLDTVAEKLDEFGSNMSMGIGWADFWVSFAGNGIKAFDQIAQKSKNTQGEVKEGWNKAAKFIMTSAVGMLTGTPITAGILGQKWDVDDAWERFTALNEKAMSGFEKFKSGDLIGALIDNIDGLSEVFGTNTKKIDREIKEQAKLIEGLEYEYSRLDVAIQKSFGSEYIYNYNRQLEDLAAKAEAYRKQAELEESKGKKADQDKVDEYMKQARDVEDQIMDMQDQLAEFFAGTDLTSAAEDFANAWIEAYKEFGSTTDAMSEKFESMIQSMINRSLAAKIMQDLLQPIFEQIDAMSRDGLLGTEEIASIAALAQERIPMINDAMTNLMTSLAAAGLDVRTSTAGFTGISRNIANASEESILGLAAGINTQNFYMSYVPTISENVGAILAAMTGGANPAAPVATTETGEIMPSVQQMVYDHLPNLDQNLAEMLRLFRSVITTKNSSTNTNYVAVK